MRTQAHARQWSVVLAAAAILLVTMGIRQSLGLFVQPLARSTGIGIAAISFALAVGQFVWGAVQPIFGVLAIVARSAVARARRVGAGSSNPSTVWRILSRP
jgi:hypothetical protein